MRNNTADIVCQIEEDETTVHAKIDEDSENIIQTAIPDTVKKIDDVKTKSMKNGRPFYRRWRATSEGKPKTGKYTVFMYMNISIYTSFNLTL